MKSKYPLGKLLLALSGLCAMSSTLATDYTWSTSSGNWASSSWLGSPAVNPATGPVDGDNIIGVGGNIVLTVGASRQVDNLTNQTTVGTTWTLQAGGGQTAVLTADNITNAAAGNLNFRAAIGTGTMSVSAINVSQTGSGITNLGTTTAANALETLQITGTTAVSAGVMNVNVDNDLVVDPDTYSLGLINVSGTGTLTLNQAGYAKPGTTVANSTGLIGSGGQIVNGTLVTGSTNVSSLVVTTSGSYSTGSLLANGQGTLALTKSGTGTQVLSADNTYTGGTTITAGQLQLGNGGTTGAIVGNVSTTSASAQLAFNRSNAYTFGGTISGSGSVLQVGTGTVILAASNSYSGGTTISAGTLLVSNGAGSATGTGNVSVAAGALLGGNGIIAPSAGNNVSVNGTLSPGIASADVLTFNLGSGSKLDFGSGAAIEMTLGTASDRIVFTSTGDWLSGSGNATLSLTLGPGFDYNNSYVIFDGVSTVGFTLADVTGYDTGAYTHSFSLVGDDYVLSFTAVPEPGVVALLGLAGIALVWRRILRRSQI